IPGDWLLFRFPPWCPVFDPWLKLSNLALMKPMFPEHLFFYALAGGHPQRARLLRWRLTSGSIIRRSLKLMKLSDADLERSAREIRWRCLSGEPLSRLMPTAYALVREATRRELGFSHYPVQVMGGIALFEGGIAEMQTG